MKKNINVFLIISFLVFLTVPTFVKFFDLDDSSNENKVVKKIPSFDINKIDDVIKDFDAYYKENFGGRMLLFNFYSGFKYKILNESALPERVYLGKDGWLFLGDLFGDGVKESLGIIRFSDADLIKVKSKLLQNKKFLDSLDIKYYVIVAPDKQSVHTEYLPYTINGQTTKLDQLMATNTPVKIIDIKSILFKKKDSLNLYFKTDTHWNKIGAFFAYEEVMRQLVKEFPMAKALNINDFIVRKKTGSYFKDMSKMLNKKIEDVEYDFYPKVNSTTVKEKNKFKIPSFFIENINPERQYEFRFKNELKPLKVLIFRDSFTNALLPYFKETFNSTVFVWQTDLNYEFIKNEKPDIVI